MVNFQDELKKRTEEINKVIQSYLPEEEGFAKTMAQAMNYSILEMGPITKKLYETLTGIQMGRIQAPEGWLKVIE